MQELVAHLPEDSATIYIMPGVYWIDNPDDPIVKRGVGNLPPIGMTISCANLRMTGLGSKPDDVVLASQRGQSQGAEGNFTMFNFRGRTLGVDNLTMGDYLNVDLDYQPDPTLSRKKKSATITQGQLAFFNGDTLRARNCRFVSRLNLCPIIGGGWSVYDNCHFESTDDALNGNALYRHCDFDLYSSKPIYRTNDKGAWFYDCRFYIKHSGDQHFTKRPSKVGVVNSHFYGPADTYVGWTQEHPNWLRCYQHGNTYHAVAADGTEKTIPLTIESAHPNLSVTPPDADALVLYEHHFDIDKHQLTLTSDRDSMTIFANRQGIVSWNVDSEHTAFLRIEPFTDADGRIACRLTPTNDSNGTQTVVVTAKDADGYEAACEVVVLPSPLPPPGFIKSPSIRIKDGKATVDYRLDLKGCIDESEISWYRISEEPGTGEATCTLLSQSLVTPARDYTLRSGDVGSRIMASVTPKSNRSHTDRGTAVETTSRTVKRKDVVNPNLLETDFSRIRIDSPVSPLSMTDDTWHTDCYKPADTDGYDWAVTPDRPAWYYGEGINGCKGFKGLLQNVQGARLFYRPATRAYGNMRVVLDVTPAKTAGQGFSSNRMQYMDVFVKFDERTLSGYGLRIIRTLKHGNAVDFQLMRYDRGNAVPLSDAVSSTCYRQQCKIVLGYADGTLTADVTTDAPSSDPSLPNSVSLSASVADNSFGTFGIQHTGTTGEGQTMLRHLAIRWD